MKIFFATIALFMFYGCSTLSKPVTEFRLKTKLPDIKMRSYSCLQKSIKVSKPFSSNILKSVDMSYAQGDSKLFSYTESVWTESPTNSIGAEIIKALRDSNLFRSVQPSMSRTKDDIILETNIDEFLQHFNEELNNSYAIVSINFTLIDSYENKVLNTKNFKSNVEVDTLDANGGVKALNEALSNVLLDSTLWIGEVCR